MLPKNLFVGIDCDLKSFTCRLLNDQGDILAKTELPNSLKGAERLQDKIIQTMQQYDFNKLIVGTEATNLYDFHIAEFILHSEKLSSYSLLFYRLNPKLVKYFKKNYPDTDKTDDNDAFFIAERLRFGHLPHPYHSNQLYSPLQRLTRYRFHLAHSITREKNFFLSQLFLKFSGLSQNKVFSNTFGHTSIELLKEFFTVDDIVSASVENLVQFIIKNGKKHFSDPEMIAEAVQRAARESYRLRPSLAKSVNLILSSTIQNIRALDKAIKEVNKAIENEFNAFPNTLKSIPGLGPVYASGILAEIGDVNRFKSNTGIAKLTGLWWKRYQSGDFEAENVYLSPSCNRYLRYYLIEGANSLRVHNEEYRIFYWKKYQEVPKHQHKRAIVLTARKLVRLIYAMLKRNQLYSASFVPDTRKVVNW